MVNWDYWYWERRHRQPVITGEARFTPALENRTRDSRVEKRISGMLEVMELMTKRMLYLQKQIDTVKAQNPKIVVRGIVKEPAVRSERKTIIKYPKLKDAHKLVLGHLLESRSMLTYREIAVALGMAVSSVRVYFNEMERMNISFVRKKIGNKVVIGLSAETSEILRTHLSKN